MASTSIDLGAVLLGIGVAGIGRRAGGEGVSQAPVRRHDAARPSRRTALRLQRHQPRIRGGCSASASPTWATTASGASSIPRSNWPSQSRRPRRFRPCCHRAFWISAVRRGRTTRGNDLGRQAGLPRQDQTHRRRRLRQHRPRDGVEAVQDDIGQRCRGPCRRGPRPRFGLAATDGTSAQARRQPGPLAAQAPSDRILRRGPGTGMYVGIRSEIASFPVSVLERRSREDHRAG